ncbi:MAG: hypothetical protein EOO06_06090 [Chitinophagaceae bacterium]|nr:MAG: hypothetical protein EOO06_06090 [Chitinophagaceae bacterium]
MRKKTLSILGILAFVGAALVTGCNEGEVKKEEMKTETDATKSSTPSRDTSKIDTTAEPRPLRPGN